MSTLDVKNLCKKYPREKNPVLHNISFSVTKNSLFVILGKSGSGKSTLLNLIAGLELPDTGEISIDGNIVFDSHNFVEPEQRKLGMIFQDHSLFPHKNVFQNIAFGLHALPKKQRKNRVQEMLTLIELEGFEKKYPSELSGGEIQRIALARSLAPSPKILLMDEPFSKIDVILKTEIRKKIKHILQQTNTTTILVTHDREDVFSMADTMLILEKGKLGQIGTPTEIYRNPHNHSIANILGLTNKIPATQGENGYETIFGTIPPPICTHKDHQDLFLILRPENFILSHEEGVLGKVEQIDFWGENYKVIVKINESYLTIFTKREFQLNYGDSIRVKLVSFSSKNPRH